MQPHHAKFLEMAKQSIENAHAATESDLRIGVLSGTGHGDHARGIAFCASLRQAHPDAHIFIITCLTGTMVEIDLCHNARLMGFIDAYLPMQQVPRELAIHHLRDHFTVFFDAMPYPVGTYWNPEFEHFTTLQTAANARMQPFVAMYSAHPRLYMLLKHRPMTQWEIMSITSGYEVSPTDLIPPLELAPIPEGDPGPIAAHAGSDNWQKAKLTGVPRYVCIHNSAGEGQTTKCADPAMFQAIVSRLKADGVRCVQLGVPDEPKIKGAIDRRGLRLPLSAKLILESICLVDVEGFLPYVASGVGVPSVVFFGPTPPFVFAMKHNLNLIRLEGEEACRRAPCPLGTCFWLGEDWSAQCPLQGRGNPCLPYCQNFETPDRAAQAVAAFVQEREGMVA